MFFVSRLVVSMERFGTYPWEKSESWYIAKGKHITPKCVYEATNACQPGILLFAGLKWHYGLTINLQLINISHMVPSKITRKHLTYPLNDLWTAGDVSAHRLVLEKKVTVFRHQEKVWFSKSLPKRSVNCPMRRYRGPPWLVSRTCFIQFNPLNATSCA